MTDLGELVIETESVYDERRVALRISGIAALPAQPNGQFLPQGIIIAYGRPRGEPWRCIRTEVYGPKLTKSGGLSATTAKMVWCGHETPPDWVHYLIGTYWPLADQWVRP